MIAQGIVTLDIHGMTCYQAGVAVDAALRRAKGVYCIRIIHGGNHGSALKDMVSDRYGKHPQVLRIRQGANPGQTELVLREL